MSKMVTFQEIEKITHKITEIATGLVMHCECVYFCFLFESLSCNNEVGNYDTGRKKLKKMKYGDTSCRPDYVLADTV